MKYNRAKGVFDIFAEENWKSVDHYNYVEEVLTETAKEFGFSEIRTPIFEKTELFTRTSGESSDIVSKEMYSFLDKANRSLSLRPEGTAPVMRAYLENNLLQNKRSQKLFYIGPYFRYDRPQAGRYRQFHQFGAEVIGVDDPMQDVEIIDLLYTCYQKLGLKNLHVLINCIGDFEARKEYEKKLYEHLLPYKESLSEDSQKRLPTNPLRILDSKNSNDQEIAKKAPSIDSCLSNNSKKNFDLILNQLEKLHIPYTITPSLVRGLDYYTETVFEITSSELGAQSTIGAGGRYDTLLSMLGGPQLPAVGFGTGIERILQTLEKQNLLKSRFQSVFAYLIPLDEDSKFLAYSLIKQIRAKGIPSDLYLRGKKLNKAMQFANELNSQYAIIIGENERSTKQIKIKHMSSGEEITTFIDSLADKIETLWGHHA